MKKLKQPIFLCISLLLLFWPPKSTNSCGFYISMEEYRFWTFDPNMGSEPGLQPLFYSMDYSHNGFYPDYNAYDAGEKVALDNYDENVNLWSKYCLKKAPNKKVSKDDIRLILYNTAPINYFAIKDGLLEENSFLKFAKANPAVLQYLDFAKKAEYQSNFHDSWSCPDGPEIIAPGKIKPGERYYSYSDYEISPDPINGLNTIEEGKHLLAKCKDPFLKQRYAFQIVRTSFYNLDSISLIENYNQYLAPLPIQNWLRNNALLYEVEFHSGPERNLGLAHIFDVCPDKRFRCEELFKNALFEETYQLASNKHEQALIQVMHTLQQPMEQLSSLQKIMALEPNNKFLPFLLVREINKLEDWILAQKYNGFGSTRNEGLETYSELSKIEVDKQKARDTKYAQAVLTFVESSLEMKELPRKSFYNLAAGYIAFILKDLKLVEKYYKKVKIEELGELGKTQFLINNYMLSLSLSDKVTHTIENDLYACLERLRKMEITFPQYKQLSYQLVNFSAAEFIQRGSLAKGLMLYGKSAQPYAYHPLIGIGNVYTQIYSYATPNAIDEMIALINKQNPSPFEKYLAGTVYTYTYDVNEYISSWDVNKLLDLKSMKLVQADKLILAYDAVKKIDTAYWSNEVNSLFRKDDPFCLNPWDGHAPFNFRNVRYNKVSFLKELISLKTAANAAKGEAKARLLLKIANAYYSMTFNGKFWIMQKNYHMGYSPEDGYTTDGTVPNTDLNYYSGARAKYYYHQILAISKDPKLLGATVYILNTAYELNEAQLKINRARIKSNSNATDYYEQLSGNCDLFYEFIKTYN